MKTFSPKSKTETQQARNYPTSRAAESASEFIDNRPEAIAHRKSQDMMNRTPQVQRLAQLQDKMNNSPRVKALAQLQDKMNNSPRQVAQRKQCERMFGPAVQRQKGLEEEELQMKAEPGTLQQQSLEDGELLQGKLYPVQRQGELEDDELLQEKFDPIQRQGMEDGELVQGNFAASETPTQPENRTGMPDDLKASIEGLSGLSMDDVKVHYNSSKPAQLSALAYTQGTDIHVGPGQDQHLPHEAWHVVQQKQSRVKPTKQARGVAVNEDTALEHEADIMGMKALQMRRLEKRVFEPTIHSVSRRYEEDREKDGIKGSKRSSILKNIIQRLSLPPAAAPAAGTRNGNQRADGAPVESDVTTIHGGPNDLVGTGVGGAIILGWNYVAAVGAGGPWVRFHMINQQIGGLGQQDNLVPTSHATNHQTMWRRFENTCQHYVNNQTSTHITVDVAYPAKNNAAAAGTLAANQHFYPSLIRGRCYIFDPVAGTYNLPPNGVPPNQATHAVNIIPFPLSPPVNAHKTNLTHQGPNWLRNTLMGGLISQAKSLQLFDSFQGNLNIGENIDDHIANSQEPTDEMELLDAIESFIAIDLQHNARVIPASRLQIYNGVFHI